MVLFFILFIAINSRAAIANMQTDLINMSSEHYENVDTADKIITLKDQSGGISPKIQNPLIPFGSITGKPTEAQLEKYLNSFRDVGIEQFMIYPRSGLEIEYMSEEWLDICEYIIEYAAKYGMTIWLYDEFNWPSGSSKGQVIKMNEDFASKKISVYKDPVNLGEENYYWSVSSVPLYADILNPNAVDAFISLTHEKYYKRFKKYFGTVIKGIFSDEPSPMYAARRKTAGSLMELTYWNELEVEYKQHANRDFRKDIEAHLNGSTPVNLWEDYYYLLGKKFKESYVDKLTNWCNQHNILLTGHLMEEVAPSRSLKATGDPLSVSNAFSMPGIDEIFTHTSLETIEWVTMKTVENAVRDKTNGAFVELFALGPSDMTLGKRRQMIWLSALHGVDHYLLAISAMDARANFEDKPAYFNPHTTTQPWFKAMGDLGEDAKQAALFARKNTVSPLIAVRYPQRLTANTMFSSKEEQAEITLNNLLKSLVSWQWTHTLINEKSSQVSEYDVILSFSTKGISEEKSGENFNSLEELSIWLESDMQRDVLVENSKGEICNDLLVKAFTDGSVCVVSLSDSAHNGPLKLMKDGKQEILFDFPESGVFVYEPGQHYVNVRDENVLKISTEELLPYELSSTNLMRIDFDETGSRELILDDALENISFVIRNYGDNVEIDLDGHNLKTNGICKILTDGLNELYLETDKISLKNRRHTLKLKSGKKDIRFLPTAFIGGMFIVKNKNVLGGMPKTLTIGEFQRQGLQNYIGSISFTKELNINNQKYLSVDANGLVTEIFIEGQSIGRKSWTPFLWKIPPKYIGKKVDVKIIIWTSVGPLFK